jgi:hypothetical protein
MLSRNAMPITPFHFGPGAALHAAAPKHLSFLAFCAANVLIDVEPLYFMLTHQDRLHRFFHTYIGATFIALATFSLFLVARRLALRWNLQKPFNWQALRLRSVALGATAGSYSHIMLDSLMHRDITPLAPFSDANPLWRAVSLSTLHWGCIGAGVLGLLVLGVRRLLTNERVS